MTPASLCRFAAALTLPLVLTAGCQRPIPTPDLGDRYNRTAQYHGPDRNPVIVIPGILGSKLTHPPTGTRVWGAFEPAAANPATPEGARLIALPMAAGKSLAELTDDVVSDGALDTVRLSVFGLPIELQAYARILGTLGVGGYLDDQLAESGAVDYGTDHYSCFQFDYDWRRDNVENAKKLYAFIKEHRAEVQENLAEDYGGLPGDYDVKFDIVAHSMGGLITRYMLRYGNAPPEIALEEGVTWKGAEHVDRVVLIGTPNAGSVKALTQLIDGAKISPLHPGYSAAVLGTMPSIYQLLPRDRHRRVHWSRPKPAPGLVFDLAGPPHIFEPSSTWDRLGWGLASPKQDGELAKLLPDVADAEDRRRIARDHLGKCLRRAEEFHQSLDRPARRPEDLQIILYAGDGVPTPDVASVDFSGRVERLTRAPGDGTVTRDSALMDERIGGASGGWTPHLVSPIDWADVNFLFQDHIGLTADPVFADNVLYLLLESPRREDPAGS
ncbi:MAG: hypothetical protein AAF800_04475 [Planctomycetota bacterium]